MASFYRSAAYCSSCLSRIPSRRFVHSAALRRWRMAPMATARSPFSQVYARTYALKSQADQAMEDIEKLYENAREEFQIAAEETEENTIYAADDRAAARAEFEKLMEAFTTIVDGTEYAVDTKEEIRKRAGHRIRELENAVEALEAKAMNQD